MATANNITVRQAIKFAKEAYREEHGKRAYNASISIMQGRQRNEKYVLIIAGGVSTEFFFTPKTIKSC